MAHGPRRSSSHQRPPPRAAPPSVWPHLPCSRPSSPLDRQRKVLSGGDSSRASIASIAAATCSGPTRNAFQLARKTGFDLDALRRSEIRWEILKADAVERMAGGLDGAAPIEYWINSQYSKDPRHLPSPSRLRMSSSAVQSPILSILGSRGSPSRATSSTSICPFAPSPSRRPL